MKERIDHHLQKAKNGKKENYDSAKKINKKFKSYLKKRYKKNDEY